MKRDLSSAELFLASYSSFLSDFLPIAEIPALWADISVSSETGFDADFRSGSSISLLEWQIFKRWTSHLQPRFTLIHAAVAGKDENAVVFPGVTGSGKTTLLLSLLKRGYRYLSDDCAVLGPESTTLWPAPGALHIKAELPPGHEELFEALLQYPPGFYSGDHPAQCGFVRTRFLPRAASPWSIAAVVFPYHKNRAHKPEAAEDNSESFGPLVAITPGRALTDLMFHSFARRPDHLAHDFRCLGAMLRSVPAYRLYSRDLDVAGQALDGLLAQAAE